MKQPLLALAAVLVAGSAGAQTASGSSVQIYGLMDAGVEYLSNADANKHHISKVTSGGMNTSRWGVRGSEDLGGGLKAIYNLEGGIFLDTGAQDGVLFKRAALVGLERSYGSLVAGHGFTTVYDFLGAFDPMGYSPSYSWILAGSATGVSKYGMTTAFDNLIKYTGKFGPVKVGATVGLGEQPDGAANSRKYALGAVYAYEALALVGTWEQINGNTVIATGNRDETRALHLAGSYTAGDAKIIVGARDHRLVAGKAATADVKARLYWAGLAYKVTPQVTLTGALYFQDIRNVAPNTDADPRMLVLRAKYAMSPRTDLYTTLGRVNGKHGKAVGLSRDDVAFGTNQTGLIAGIQHRF